MQVRTLLLGSIVFASALAAPAAFAMKEDKTAAGVTFLTGGVTQQELADIRMKRRLYNVQVLTAARPSGAHLSDVKLVISTTKGEPVLDVVMEGPYLLANLEPGTYDFEGTYQGKSQKQRVVVAKGGDREVVFRFDSQAELSPDLKKDAAK